MKKVLCTFALLMLSVTPVLAETAGPAAPPATHPVAITARITVQNGHAFETAPGQMAGAAFFNIVNNGSDPDTLLSAKVGSDIAQSAELHRNYIEAGMMEMTKIADCPIPPGKTIVFDPAGYHVMLMGLTKPLKAGDTFPLTLNFDKAGAIKIDVAVGPAGDIEPKIETMQGTP